MAIDNDLQKCIEESEEAANKEEGEAVSEFIKSVGGVWGKEVVEQATFGTKAIVGKDESEEIIEDYLVSDAAEKYTKLKKQHGDEYEKLLKKQWSNNDLANISIAPLFYQLNIGYDMWVDNIHKLNYDEYYAIGTYHKMEDKAWMVKEINKNIEQQRFEITFVLDETKSLVGLKCPPLPYDGKGAAISAVNLGKLDGSVTLGNLNIEGTTTGRISMAAKQTPRVRLFAQLCNKEVTV